MKRAEPPPAAPKGAPARTILDWPAEAGVVDRLVGRIEQKIRGRRRRRAAAGAGTVVAGLLIAFWLIPWLRYTGSLATPAAQRQNVAFADGSLAELNAQTSLQTDFRPGHRRVRLDKGEAYFSVAKDAAHPFYVETPQGVIRVIGTVFNVRLTPETTEVTLLEGTVAFERGGTEPVNLVPGQQLAADQGAPRIQRLPSAELENVTAWREGRLVLDGLFLADVAATLGRYHGVRITVSPAVARLRPGGTVPLDQLSGVLEALQETLPIRIERDAETIRLVAR